MKTEFLLSYEPTGEIIYKDNFKFETVIRSSFYLFLIVSVVSVIAFFIINVGEGKSVLTDWPILIIILGAIVVPIILQFFLAFRESKKTYYHLRFNGIEIRIDKDQVFIPYDKIHWVGKVRFKSVDYFYKRFGTEEIIPLLSRHLLIFSPSYTFILETPGGKKGVMLSIPETFIGRVKTEMELRGFSHVIEV